MLVLTEKKGTVTTVIINRPEVGVDAQTMGSTKGITLCMEYIKGVT